MTNVDMTTTQQQPIEQQSSVPYYIPNQVLLHATYNPKINQTYFPFIPNNEEFRQVSLYIPEVEDNYFISNYGRLYNSNTGYLVSPCMNSGYYSYVLKRKKEYVDKGMYETYTVSEQILVCTCFVSPRPGNEYQTTHYDGNSLNNYYQNLGWAKPTPPQKITSKGETVNLAAKYNDTQVRFVCELLQSGVYDYDEISRRVFGCEIDKSIRDFIYSVHTRRNWTQISKNYQFDDTAVRRNFIPEFILHMIFSFGKEHPEIMENGAINGPKIYAMMGVNLDVLDESTRNRYLSTLNKIRTNPTSYASVREMYK